MRDVCFVALSFAAAEERELWDHAALEVVKSEDVVNRQKCWNRTLFHDIAVLRRTVLNPFED